MRASRPVVGGVVQELHDAADAAAVGVTIRLVRSFATEFQGPDQKDCIDVVSRAGWRLDSGLGDCGLFCGF